MLLPGTQMHLITFFFVCAEVVILIYLIIYYLARPDDRRTGFNIVLIVLLLVYNITGGLLPDENLPGSVFVQEAIAYGTGFITPCFFPFYVYRVFGLEKMYFHAFRGVFYFLILPYVAFVLVYWITGSLSDAKNILGIPVLYALWVIFTLVKAIRFKYSNDFSSKQAKEEIVILLLSLLPWAGLPIIVYFDLSQEVEAPVTNTGFLLLLMLCVKRGIEQLRAEHLRLEESERRLQGFRLNLQREVEERAGEWNKFNDQKTQTLVSLLTTALKELNSKENGNGALVEDAPSQKTFENYRLFGLTSREREVVELIRKGLKNKEIAETLFISERTVTKHIQNVFGKVKVSSKLELIYKLDE